MHILIDAILVLVFLITVIHYYKVGFIKALFSVCKFFLSVVIAFSLASPLGALISERYILAPVQSATNEMIRNLADDESSNVSDLVERMPDSVKHLIFSSGSSSEELDDELSEMPLDDNNITKIADAVSDKISIVISSIIAFLIVFVLSMILFTLLAFVLDKIFSLPVLKQTNKFLGCVLGVLFGVFHVFMSSTIITLVLHLIGVNNPDIAVNKVRESAVIYSLVESIDLSRVILDFFRLG